ncbi:ribbon-helix-helix protein, CopG family [Erythrobacter donghaensis]|jgi:predicted transcriptional regulator|uniref:ribbon-helix-helix protein, CopG family n=1 Tax=Erythrobacter donghaensis TaxID=267135 RepID=UPI00093F83E3|nr:ribbon-helix-helix protein, CopG family [Erythrobacter donghaensis]
MKKPDRQKMTFRIDAHLARQLSERARTRRVSQTEVLEAALASMLTPDSDERIEAVVTKRLDRLARQLERLEWHVELSNEAFAIFVRFWLTSNTPLPDEAMRAAQATGKQRYQAFVESLAKRMDAGPKLRDEIDS